MVIFIMYNRVMKNKLQKNLTLKSQILILIGVLIVVVLGALYPKLFPSLSDRERVSFRGCIDGDTARFQIGNSVEKVRFIAVDTPELTSNDFYAKEARDYTCSRLGAAQQIELEYDPLADDSDKYGRKIAWVYVDGDLLQKEIVAQGFGKVRYVYDKYKYVDELNALQKEAKKARLGVWRK